MDIFLQAIPESEKSGKLCPQEKEHRQLDTHCSYYCWLGQKWFLAAFRLSVLLTMRQKHWEREEDRHVETKTEREKETGSLSGHVSPTSTTVDRTPRQDKTTHPSSHHTQEPGNWRSSYRRGTKRGIKFDERKPSCRHVPQSPLADRLVPAPAAARWAASTALVSHDAPVAHIAASLALFCEQRVNIHPPLWPLLPLAWDVYTSF